jgi:hypothetical protein
VFPPRDEWTEDGPEYLYREGHVLIRDADIGRVTEVLRGGRPAPSRRDRDDDGGSNVNVNGLTLFELPPLLAPDDDDGGEPVPLTVHRALLRVDTVLGVGVAAPDHVVFLCPSHTGSGCPATEPEEVPPGSGPDPAVGAPEACDGAGTLVAVIDSGLTGTSPPQSWMTGVLGEDERTLVPNGPIQPYEGHGTFCAGMVRTVAPRADVYVWNAFLKVGAEFESTLAAKIVLALEQGPDVISLSFGCVSRDSIPPIGFEVVRERVAELKGVVVVAAAGNDGVRAPFWPAASPWTVSVGALTLDGRAKARFSNFGGWVDVYAPGENLVNAFCAGTYTCTETPNIGQVRKFDGMARWSGTSFSTPMVAGLIAARMSATGENGQQAAAALLRRARKQAIPGLGAVIFPGQACEDGGGCC